MEQVREAASTGGWNVIADAGNRLSVGRERTTMQVSFADDGRFVHASMTAGLDGMAQVVIEPLVIPELVSVSAGQSGPGSSEEQTT
jgi:hypothetical protein